MVFNRELDLGCHQLGILVDGDLVDRRIVLFLFLFSLLLFFLWSHSPLVNIIIAVAFKTYPLSTFIKLETKYVLQITLLQI